MGSRRLRDLAAISGGRGPHCGPTCGPRSGDGARGGALRPGADLLVLAAGPAGEVVIARMLLCLNSTEELEPTAGFEPATFRLQGDRSAI